MAAICLLTAFMHATAAFYCVSAVLSVELILFNIVPKIVINF